MSTRKIAAAVPISPRRGLRKLQISGSTSVPPPVPAPSAVEAPASPSKGSANANITLKRSRSRSVVAQEPAAAPSSDVTVEKAAPRSRKAAPPSPSTPTAPKTPRGRSKQESTQVEAAPAEKKVSPKKLSPKKASPRKSPQKKTPTKSPKRTFTMPTSPMSPPLPRLSEMKRPQVQVIAKKLGIKATMPTQEIVSKVDRMIQRGDIAKYNVAKRSHEGTGRDLYEAAERRGKKRKLSVQVVNARDDINDRPLKRKRLTM